MSVVLVAGASGLFGSHMAQAFADAGWQVRKYQRGTDMAAAAMGADVIVNALNPPNYHDWAQQMPMIAAQVIAAAQASGATIIVPGNVYNFGVQPGVWGPDVAQVPNTIKGAARKAMEAQYRASGLPVIILRGGDFIDADGKAQFMSMMLKPLPKGKISLFGGADVQRAYAYLPDMARAAVGLAQMRAALPRFADVPFAGLTFSMNQLRDAFQAQSGRSLRFGKFPWWIMRIASPFWELAREFLEMRYLYETPHSLDPAPMAKLLPDFKITSFQQMAEIQAKTYGLKSTQTGR